MFGFGKKKSVDSVAEEVNVVRLASAAFESHGYSVVADKACLHHPDSGFTIFPKFVGARPLDGGAVGTLTTVQTNHLSLVPDGVFEYQHSTGKSISESISKGFDQWVQTDFVPLLDALRPKPEFCTMLEMAFPAEGSRPARVRRAILGPVAHFMQEPPKRSAETGPEEHPFCPCCFLTKSFDAFREFIEGEGFYGLRFFAARDREDKPQADCRVNGQDYAKGAEALRQYVKSWPAAGFEFRKQYVLLQTIDKPAEPLSAADRPHE
jgi:hypothetical protein